MRRCINKKGYIVTEAAILMPIFIIGMVALAFVIKYGIIFENVHAISADETEKTIIDMHYDMAELATPLRLKDRIQSDEPSAINPIISPVLPMPSFADADDVMTFSVDFGVNVPFASSIGVNPKSTLNMTFRPFVGQDYSKILASAETTDEYEEVWVFPRAGERYHCKDCQFIASYPRQMILSQGVKLQYDPCRLCGARKLPIGSVVYCFETGHCYHCGDCAQVDKYVVAMNRADAEARGYTPCLVCGGYKP